MTEFTLCTSAVVLVVCLLAAIWRCVTEGETRQCCQVVDVDYFDHQWPMLVDQCTGDTWILTPVDGGT